MGSCPRELIGVELLVVDRDAIASVILRNSYHVAGVRRGGVLDEGSPPGGS